MSVHGLEIRSLHKKEGELFFALLERQPRNYREHFHPFPDESVPALSGILEGVVDDVYKGVFWKAELVAFFMLRGMDDGYERPSFGVLVDHAYRGRGLGRLCLNAALSECRLRGFPSCMLKVSPDNDGARFLYESVGFVRESICEVTGHVIYSLDFAT